jgi:hypothetical protein
VAGGVRGPALRAAEDLLRASLDASLARHLSACICAARVAGAPGAAAAGEAAVRGLAALAHCPAVRATSGSWLEHFPLAQAVSSKVGGRARGGCV